MSPFLRVMTGAKAYLGSAKQFGCEGYGAQVDAEANKGGSNPYPVQQRRWTR